MGIAAARPEALHRVEQASSVGRQAQDRKVLKRINALLVDIERDGNEGNGKPEALKHDFAGYWYRRITDASPRLQDRRR